jgi:hypothetical protein
MNKKTILKTLIIGLMSLLVLSSITPSASNQIKTNNIQTLSQEDWCDDFDSYENDQFLDGGPDDGGWRGWDNNSAAGAYVRDDYFRSEPYSVEIADASDLIYEFQYTAGDWCLTAWQYIPSDLVGDTGFIVQSEYHDGGPYEWVVQLSFNSETGMVEAQFYGLTMIYKTDQWVEIRCDFNITDDLVTIYYDGELLASYNITSTIQGSPPGTGPQCVATLDLWANGASPVYYDDICMIGETGPVADLDCEGSLTWTDINAGATVTGEIQVSNIGETGSLLNWEVATYPVWGTWTFTPSSGTDLEVGSSVTVNVSVVAPSVKNEEFTGIVKLVNSIDASDFCEIDASLTTPRARANTVIQRILERFPNAFQILRYILNL